jgi:DNA adenine methylase
MTPTPSNWLAHAGVAARYPTPLRYPGGKGRLGAFFADVLVQNGLIGTRYLEPFAGGAGVGLFLLQSGLVDSIGLNDLDRAIYAFWYAATHRNLALRRLVASTPITVREWDRQKEVQREKRSAPLLDLGFSTLFLNRTNRSGILRAGMIGGRAQDGHWGLNARFNKGAIIERLAALHPYVSRISVDRADAVEFLANCSGRSSKSTFAYLDPPYFVKGRDLYLNGLTSEDHHSLASFVRRKLRCSWVVTDDDVREIRRLYPDCRKQSYRLDYTADARRDGREIMISSTGLHVPRVH